MPNLAGIPCIDGFWQFVELRMEAYHLHRSFQKSPDPVLSSGHYPNVKRELDAGTVFFQAHLLNRADVIPTSILYRLLNRRQTFEAYGSLPTVSNLPAWRTWITARAYNGVPIFTARHQTISFKRYLTTLDFLEGPFYPALATMLQEVQKGSREHAWTFLQELTPGLGQFTAWQVLCDVMETYKLDENLWAYMGPGPQGAYQMIHGESAVQKEVLAFARTLVTPEFTLKNIEHALCEYFRYTRAHWSL